MSALDLGGGRMPRKMTRRLLDLARQWDRWADEYDAQARRNGNPLIACQLTAWAQAYRNAAALLVLTVQPRPKAEWEGAR